MCKPLCFHSFSLIGLISGIKSTYPSGALHSLKNSEAAILLERRITIDNICSNFI
eukprot:TRINITY_DN1382_c0_g1_i1.p1 TRINITY_DN1382_c0_g1~~TRINITY_DN1382_c0_g1_i1.p1  ORF type:complete len:55 (+),score=2.32 TRINITY_DN1382_c0_g1_i1:422-586(+)